MSNYALRLAIAFGGLLAVGVSVCYVVSVSDREPGKRPAISSAKSRRSGPLTTQISLIGADASQVGDAFMLEATVRASSRIQNARFQWFLPADVQVIDGLSENEIESVGPDEAFKTRISLRLLQKGDKQIHFVVSASQKSASFTSIAEYDSTAQDFLDQGKSALLNALQRSQERAMRLFK